MKKILCICLSLAFVVMMMSCKKECVCKRSVSYLEPADTTVVDSTSTAEPTPEEVTYAGGRIYDKKECEYLNVSDTTLNTVTNITCTWGELSE